MTSIHHDELVNQLLVASSKDEVHYLCCILCEQLGFDYFIFGARILTSFAKPQQLIVSGYPSAWRERYIAQGYLDVDPTVSYCATNSLPLTWDQLEQPRVNQDRSVLQFLDESRDFGLKSGISIPIHDARGGHAMLSLVSRQEHDQKCRCIKETLPFAHAISFHVHEAVLRTLNTVEICPVQYRLSNREIECLRWIAEGKTSWEASQILEISENTVIFHLQKVMHKLHVSNRCHAVARAVSMGVF